MIQRVLSLHQASCSSTQAACERYDLLVLAASLPSGPGQDAPKPVDPTLAKDTMRQLATDLNICTRSFSRRLAEF